jgi:hypothetical protein
MDKLKLVEGKFIYTPPTGGKPVGEVPQGWKEPEEVPDLLENGMLDVKEVENGEYCEVTDPDLRDDTDSGDDE